MSAQAAADADFVRLRQLLIGGTADAIEQLRRRFDDPDGMAAEIGRVLPAAIRRRNNDEHLAAALSPTIADALRAQVRKNPELVIDVVFPVLGPAIRKWIARSLEEMVEVINRTVEHTFSIQGLRWRLEARRTGQPFAEVVLAHSVVYRIEQVLLVHRETGLLLHHVLLRDPVARNPDLVSSMLTAIRAFVRDSFHSVDPTDTAELHEFRVGALTVVVEDGPRAVLTAVVRGKPPADLRRAMQEVIEEIHRELGPTLATFAGDTERFEACEPMLERCLLEKQRPVQRSRAGGLVLASAGLALVVLLGLWWMRARSAEQRWAGLVAALRAEPGIVVTNHDRGGRDQDLVGLLDPLARPPAIVIAEHGFDASTLRAVWTPVALPEMALSRARAVLAPPATVELRRSGSILQAQGRAHSSWVRRSRELVALIPGVEALTIGDLELTDAQVFAAAVADVAGRRLIIADDRLGDVTSVDGFAELLAAIDRLDLAAHDGGIAARIAVVGRVLATDGDRFLSPGRVRAEAVRAALDSHAWRCTRVTAESRATDDETGTAGFDPHLLVTVAATIDKDPSPPRSKPDR